MTVKKKAKQRRYSLECPDCRRTGSLRVSVLKREKDGVEESCDILLKEEGISDDHFSEPCYPYRVWCGKCSGNDINATELELPDEATLAAVKVPDMAKVTADIAGMVDTARFAPRPSTVEPAEPMEGDRMDGYGQDYTQSEMSEIGMTGWNRIRDRICSADQMGGSFFILVGWNDKRLEISSEKERVAERIMERGEHRNIDLFAVTSDGDRYRMAYWSEGRFFIED